MGKFNDLFVKDGKAKVTIAALVVVLVLISIGIYFSFFINPKTASQSLAPHAKNRVIVKFKQNVKNNLKKENKIAGSDIGVASVSSLNKKEGVKEIKKIIPENANKKVKGEATDTEGLDRIYVMEFNSDKDLNTIIDEYSSDPNVEFAEPDYEMATQLAPNDPYYYSSGSWGQSYADLWGIKKIDSNIAWDQATGSNSVVVAVIDTGIDYNHADLAANVWTNTDEIPNNGVDDDANGYIDDRYGYDFYNYDSDPIDDHAHGTHCSGTIGGVGNNNRGVVGVNWNIKIMGVKFLGAGGSGWISDAVSSTYYAVNNGAQVLSNSWGGGGRSTTMQTAINYAYNNNVTFVAAAGNSNSDAYNYTPAGLDHVMTISATDYQDNKASFSSWGDVVEFAAPGVDVLSLKAAGGSCTTVGTNYCRMSGTSMATPHAAGLAALVLAANPGLTPDQVQQMMQNGADDIGAPGKDIYFGYGRINAGRSIKPITHVDGTLMKTSTNDAVYVLENNKKRLIPSVAVFITWFNWRDIVIVSQGELEKYETGNEFTLRPSSLVKTADDPKVYLIDGTNRKLISNPSVFVGMGFDWGDILTISSNEMNKYTLGDDQSSVGAHANGTLVMTSNSPNVYLLDSGTKRLIPNPEVFLSRYDWQDIVIISSSEMNSYPSGDRVGFRPGAIVRASSQAQVYVITDTTKRPIPNPATFSIMGYNWMAVIITSSSELDYYSTGESI